MTVHVHSSCCLQCYIDSMDFQSLKLAFIFIFPYFINEVMSYNCVISDSGLDNSFVSLNCVFSCLLICLVNFS